MKIFGTISALILVALASYAFYEITSTIHPIVEEKQKEMRLEVLEAEINSYHPN